MSRKTRSFAVAAGVLIAMAGQLAAQEGKIRLALELEEGRSYRMRVTMEHHIVQTGMGMTQETDQMTAIVYRFDVKEVDETGVALVEWTQDSVRFSQDGLMGHIEYDSSDTAAVRHPLTRGYAAMVERSFTARMAPTGTVSDVQGFSEVLDELMTEMALPEGPEAETLRESLRSQLGDEAMADMLTGALAIYPPRPVGVGDSWSRRVEISTGFPVITENTWTLRERRDGIAVVDVVSKVSANPDAPPLRMGPLSMRIDLSGKQSGTIEIDEASGWIVRGVVHQELSGESRVTGMEAMDMTLPMEVTGTIKTESL